MDTQPTPQAQDGSVRFAVTCLLVLLLNCVYRAGYSDEKVERLIKSSLAEGFNHFKVSN